MRKAKWPGYGESRPGNPGTGAANPGTGGNRPERNQRPPPPRAAPYLGVGVVPATLLHHRGRAPGPARWRCATFLEVHFDSGGAFRLRGGASRLARPSRTQDAGQQPGFPGAAPLPVKDARLQSGSTVHSSPAVVARHGKPLGHHRPKCHGKFHRREMRPVSKPDLRRFLNFLVPEVETFFSLSPPQPV